MRVRLPVALPITLGDRFVVRESGRQETVGGGTVIDAAPVRPVSRASPGGTVDAIVAERGFFDCEELWRLTGARRRPDVGRFVASPEALKARRELLESRLRSAGSTGILVGELDEIDGGLLGSLEHAVTRFGRARLLARGGGGRFTEPSEAAVERWLGAIRSEPFVPPRPAEVPRGRLSELLQEGIVVQSRGIHFPQSAADEGRLRVHALLQASPAGVTLGEVRSALGTSRRFALALLEHFDATGVTRRTGDVRIAGPRLRSGGGSIADTPGLPGARDR